MELTTGEWIKLIAIWVFTWGFAAAIIIGLIIAYIQAKKDEREFREKYFDADIRTVKG